MTEKRCSGCGHVLPLADFHDHPCGRFLKQSRCKMCQGLYRRGHYARRRDQMLAARADG
jgi:hypothetical protein